MITAIGVEEDPTLRHFAVEAAGRGASVQVLDIPAVAEGGAWAFDLPAGTGWLEWRGEVLELSPGSPYYFRPIDLTGRLADDRLRTRFAGLLTGLRAWLTTVPGVVANRPGHMENNGSKPLHESWLQSLGFRVPSSLTSSDGRLLAEFAAGRKTVVKTVSGVRADCRVVEPDELASLHPGQGPVHLQRYVEGFDVRAHVVAGEVVAQRITGPRVDYRTDLRSATYEPWQLPRALEDRVVAGTATAGLVFAGWDFKVDSEGRHHCLEVNPMPGYDSYDRRSEGAITDALLRVLTGGAG